MATLLAQKTIGIVNIIRRTWRTSIESQVNSLVFVTAHREELQCTEDKAIIAQNQNAGVVNRSLLAVRSQTVTLGNGKILSALEVAEAVEKFIESWDAEDLASKVVEVAAPEEEVPVADPVVEEPAPVPAPTPVPDQGG